MSDLGLIIGKFNPFHLGHDYLIRQAKERVRELVVVVAERSDQPVAGEVRASWIREEHPDIEVLVTPDDLPEMPEPWAQRTLEILGDRTPDLVFSSETYGEAFANLMKAGHQLIDLDRVLFPISGTSIRLDPGGSWHMLTPPAKAHLTRRVVVTGVESSGTTTLAADLARHLGTVWVPELGRAYWEGRRYLSDQSWATNEFIAIAKGQLHLEDALARKSGPVLVCDTDALTTHVWHKRYLGDWSSRVEQISDSRKPALYIVTLPEFPFVQDGTREGEDIRIAMHEWLIDMLRKKKRSFIEVGGSPASRLQSALTAIEALPPIGPL